MIHADIPSDDFKGPISLTAPAVFQGKDENVIFVYAVPSGGAAPGSSTQLGVELRRQESVRIGAGMDVYLKRQTNLPGRCSQTQVEV